MKKKIMIIIGVFLLLGIISLILYKVLNNDNKIKPLPEVKIEIDKIKDNTNLIYYDAYKDIDINSIKEIDVTISSETDNKTVTITDSEKITLIYNAMANIYIKTKSDVKTTDDSRVYSFVLEDKKIIFSFSGNNIILNNQEYEVIGYDILKDIKI